MTTVAAYVHPAPSPALHTLNTPEGIDHDAAHPDSVKTYATEAVPRNVADLLDVVSRYMQLTEQTNETEWTHWGPSPFVKGDTHSFAVNIGESIYKCFTTHATGDVVDFIMFMEELNRWQALDWLKANFPNYYESSPVEVADENGPLPDADHAHADLAFTSAGLPGGAPLAALADAVDQAAAPALVHDAPVAHTGTVYETSNYDLFHLLPENRRVDKAHVRKLIAQISESNLLHIKPIDVTADLGVIDGQHRLAAARELGLPVYYKIGQQLSDADITTLNVAQKNWQGTDYLHSWAMKGRTDYVALRAFMQRHPTLSFSNAKMMLGVTTKSNAEEFRKGQWKAGEAYKAEQVAQLIERLAVEVPTFKQPNHTGFVAALFYCVVNVEGFDAKEFMRKILLNPRSLVPCASHKQFLAMFEEIYNYRTVEVNRLRF